MIGDVVDCRISVNILVVYTKLLRTRIKPSFEKNYEIPSSTSLFKKVNLNNFEYIAIIHVSNTMCNSSKWKFSFPALLSKYFRNRGVSY